MDIFRKRIFYRKRKVPSAKVQLRFLKQLAKLLNNGYPLVDALQILQWDNDLKVTSAKIMMMLKNGVPLASAFKQVHFHHSITSYLSFSQTSGDIKQHIEKCINMYEQRLTYMEKLNQMMRYPLMLAIVFSILLFFINRYVLPSFLDLFQTNSETSKTILYLISTITIIGKAVIILGITLLIAWLFWRSYMKKVHIKYRIKMYTNIPVYRTFMTLYTSFIFATHLSTLLKSGMTIKQILQHLTEQDKIPIISYYSSLLINEFTRGGHIDQLLGKLPLIEKQFAIIFQKNNNIAALEKDLTMYADMLLEQFHRKMMNTILMIQPIFFTLLALFIIFIYMTIMWPMFDLIKTI